MLDRILRTLVPDSLLRKMDSGAARTKAVAEESKKARRVAESQMIHSYRDAGVAVQRHPWRE